jgi:hypothetical protein
MTDQPENPPVFPQSVHPDAPFGGMTLRDLFAAAALAGMGTWMPAGFSNLNHDRARDERAYWAYQQADAMLRERGK